MMPLSLFSKRVNGNICFSRLGEKRGGGEDINKGNTHVALSARMAKYSVTRFQDSTIIYLKWMLNLARLGFHLNLKLAS